MQLSIKDHDFIIDAISLRDKIGPGLSDLFLDPYIIKLMHGADTDTFWLQRDFGLYLVGLFDTIFAADYLQYSKKSLGYLVEKYWNYQVDKTFQLADWRVRPLLPEMIEYARNDTRYLLSIFVKLLQEISDDGLEHVLQKSKIASLKLYEKPLYEPNKALNALYKDLESYTASFNPVYPLEAMHAFIRRIHSWRDQVAREEDEFAAYVLPNHLITKMACHMPKNEAV